MIKKAILHPLRQKLGIQKKKRLYIKNSYGTTPWHFLHIGRTAGSVTKNVLKNNLTHVPYLEGHSLKFPLEGRVLWFHSHKINLRHIPKGHRIIFTIRDPLDRFISGFNRRLLEGGPQARNNWSIKEKQAFTQYPTCEEFLMALFHGEETIRGDTIRLLAGIKHIGIFGSYWDFFMDPGYFKSRRKDIDLVMNQSRYNDDFNTLKKRLDLPQTITLPARQQREKSNANRIKTDTTTLPPKLLGALKRFLAKEFEFIDLCHELGLIENR